jgi:diguanylate cyclase (GGDEF)-like protein/PAS domain S-box-containing protein
VAFVAMTLTPLVFSSVFTEWETTKLMRRFVFEHNRSLALSIAHDVDQLFAEKIRMMKVVVADPAFRAMQVEHQTKVLREMVASYDGIHIAVVTDTSGRQVARSDGLPVAPVIDYSDREYFVRVMQDKKTAISDVLISKSAGWPGVVIAEPIMGEDRSIRGLLVVNIGLSSIIRVIDVALVEQHSYVYVVNKAGQVIIHSDPLQAKPDALVCDGPAEKALTGETGWLEYQCDGQKILAGYSYLPNPGWGLVAEQSLVSALAEVYAVQKANVLIIVLAVVLAIVTSLSIARTIAGRIGEISRASLQVSAGDFNTRLTVERSDEIGKLAENFNRMTEQLAQRTADLCVSEEKFRSLVENIHSGVYQAEIEENGCFTQVNPAMVQMFGYPVMVLLLKVPLRELYCDVAEHRYFLDQLQQKGFIRNHECQMRRFNGEAFWCNRSAVKRTDKSSSAQWVDGVIEDITERKQAEAVLHQAKEALERLVAERTRELTALNEELHQLSISDGLTGLGNRRSLDEMLEREWKRAAREQAVMAMLMIDLDFFKLFNDTYGHWAGDECLKAVAAEIRKVIQRPTDFAGRYGGEEFSVVLPTTDAAGAQKIGERIRRAVESLVIPHQCSLLGGVVTVSVGVAAKVPARDESVQMLVEAADQALYQAKAAGRNRVVLFGGSEG